MIFPNRPIARNACAALSAFALVFFVGVSATAFAVTGGNAPLISEARANGSPIRTVSFLALNAVESERTTTTAAIAPGLKAYYDARDERAKQLAALSDFDSMHMPAAWSRVTTPGAVLAGGPLEETLVVLSSNPLISKEDYSGLVSNTPAPVRDDAELYRAIHALYMGAQGTSAQHPSEPQSTPEKPRNRRRR